MKRDQRGITLLGFLFALVIAACFLFTGMRLLPVYSEYYAVKGSLDELSKQIGIGSKSRREIENALAARFDISYVTSVDMKKNVELVRTDGGQNLNVKYEVRKPFVYNVDFVAKFEYSVLLKGK